jgi:hypothetical protein
LAQRFGIVIAFDGLQARDVFFEIQVLDKILPRFVQIDRAGMDHP